MCFPLPNITGSCARGAKPIGILGLVYQRLPPAESGLNPAALLLYQAPPPGYEDGYYILLYVLTMVGDEAVPIDFALGIGRVVTSIV